MTPGKTRAEVAAQQQEDWKRAALQLAAVNSSYLASPLVDVATLGAARVPLQVAEACPGVVELCDRARKLGMAASASDAGVGAGMARAAALGAAMNVRINLQEMADDPEAAEMLQRADAAVRRTREASPFVF